MILNKIEMEQIRANIGMHMVRYMALPLIHIHAHTHAHTHTHETHTTKKAPAKLNIQRTYQIEQDDVLYMHAQHTHPKRRRIFETVCGTPITKMTFIALSIDRN